MTELPINQVVCGAFPTITREWPSEKINLVMFSPPYWGLRNYGENVNTVWGGDPSCKHEWIEQEFYKDSPTREASGEKWTRANGTTSNADQLKEGRWHKSSSCSKCGAWYGQLGLEPDFRMYIEHMVEVGREIKRVLRKDGSWYLNLGDTYYTAKGTCFNSGGGENSLQNYRKNPAAEQPPSAANRLKQEGLKAKCKLLMPYRVALALIDDGWICRNDLTWHKPNAMPSSVKDRYSATTESIFFFVKSRKYWFDLDAIREPHKSKFGYFNLRVRDVKRCKFGTAAQQGKLRASKEEVESYQYPEKLTKHDLAVGRVDNRSYTDPLHETEYHPAGKNPGDVIQFDPWLEILEERAQLGGAQKEAYGFYLAWKRENPDGTYEQFYDLVKSKKLSKYQKMKWQTGISDKWTSWGNYASYLHLPNPQGKPPSDFWEITTKPSNDYWCPNCKDFVKQEEMKCVRCDNKVTAHFAQYPEALCEQPIKSSCPKGGIVLDPMCGSGTTMVVAKKLGLRFIGIDLNEDYCNMARKRLAQVESPLEVFA